MKKFLIIPLFTLTLFPGVVFATNNSLFTENSRLSVNAGVKYSLGDIGEELNLNMCFKNRLEAGVVFSIRDYGHQAGIRMLKSWKIAIFTAGFQAGVNYGTVVLDRGAVWVSDGERYQGVIGYKNSLSTFIGINAGIELPFGLGTRMNLGTDYILAHSKKTNLTGPTVENDVQEYRKFIFVGLEVYLRF